MNKYQWLRRQHGVNGNGLKKIMILLIVAAMVFLMLKGCQKISQDFWDKVREKSLETIASSFITGECWDEDSREFEIPDLIMREFYPVGSLYNCGDDIKTVEADVGEHIEPQPETESVTESESVNEETETGQNNDGREPAQNNDSKVLEAAAGIIPMDKLMDYNFVLNNFYVVPSVTSLRPQVLDLEKISSVDLRIEKDASIPQILIFHTHSQEKFADSESNGKSIVDVGDRLVDLLKDEYGYNVIHLTDEFDMAGGILDRSEAYTYANARLDEVLAQNPSIQVVIDLHRDGVDASKHLVTEIDGKQTARIMLFNGVSYTKEQGDIDYLPNPYLTENLAMTYKMFLLGKINYPDLFRCIYISGYRYCLHHVPRSMLIEAGAQTNTYEEVYNAMEPLARLIDMELTMK
ncbi:MAG: stage II sporulation protein P [Lachnospiraceae bacterium]|nr:stage II sporulation protein P [Lachnospiraceae bacterium]